MSNHLAIATVTATLRRMLQDAIVADVPNVGANVTTARPTSSGSDATPSADVNVFLYKVTPNAALRNADLPTRRANGRLLQRPQVALNLDYLLTFYGNDEELVPQRLLGSVVRTLHAQPVLSREMIQNTLTALTDESFTYLSGADLADQVESVEVVPTALSAEEFSLLFSQTPYVLSATYQASVVLIEGDGVPQAALPVRETRLHVVPFRQPVIESISPSSITAETAITITGRDLSAKHVRVKFGAMSVPVESTSADRIELTLPAGIPAGVTRAQVVHDLELGRGEAPERGFASNVTAFVLCPKLKTISVATAVDLETEEVIPTLTLTVDPQIGPRQQINVLLNESPPPVDRAPRAYRFDVPPRDSMTTELVVPMPGVESGAYRVRLRVDGAESPLDTDPDRVRIP